MRPRKSSTIIKKGQNLLKNSQGFKKQEKKIQRVQNNIMSMNQQKNKNDGIKNISLISNGNANRTFMRQTKAHSLVQKKLADVDVRQQNNQNKNRIIKQQKIIGTPVRNIANKSLYHQKITKSKVFSVINPEKKKISYPNEARIQMLNTRKSKFETDSNIKNLKKDQQKEKATNIRTRNISIRPLKKQANKVLIKKQEQKVQVKNESLLKNTQQVKIEEKTQVDMRKNEKKQQQTIHKKIEINQVQLQSNKQSESIELVNQVERPIEPLVIQNSFNIQENQSQTTLFSTNNNMVSQSVIVNNSQDRNRQQENQSIQRQAPQRNSQNLPQNNQNQRNIDLSLLISNTQDIIDFINRLNLSNRIPAFDLMVSQLAQLNLIAQQVHQLGQIGNSLGQAFIQSRYSLVNVFGTRIRQLQTTIINQVGISLIASFSQRIDPQFQALVIRQPSLRNGFSKNDIEKTFDEKLTFQQVECSICLDNVKQGQKIIELQCHHEFHPICIKTWLQNSKKCPMCRAQQQRKTN